MRDGIVYLIPRDISPRSALHQEAMGAPSGGLQNAVDQQLLLAALEDSGGMPTWYPPEPPEESGRMRPQRGARERRTAEANRDRVPDPDDGKRG